MSGTRTEYWALVLECMEIGVASIQQDHNAFLSMFFTIELPSWLAGLVSIGKLPLLQGPAFDWTQRHPACCLEQYLPTIPVSEHILFQMHPSFHAFARCMGLSIVHHAGARCPVVMLV